eukprot:5191403-Prymnesium_polylepis.1
MAEGALRLVCNRRRRARGELTRRRHHGLLGKSAVRARATSSMRRGQRSLGGFGCGRRAMVGVLGVP